VQSAKNKVSGTFFRLVIRASVSSMEFAKEIAPLPIFSSVIQATLLL